MQETDKAYTSKAGVVAANLMTSAVLSTVLNLCFIQIFFYVCILSRMEKLPAVEYLRPCLSEQTPKSLVCAYNVWEYALQIAHFQLNLGMARLQFGV